MLRDKDGNRLYRRVQVTIIFPDSIFPTKRLVAKSEPRKGFGPSGIDGILDNVTEQLDTLYPFWEFKMHELAPEGRTQAFVFTFAGYRAGTSGGQPVPVPTEDPEIKVGE